MLGWATRRLPAPSRQPTLRLRSSPPVAQTLTTCKYATVAQPVCDVYTVPKGGGGVFGLTGNVPVAGNFCGGAACSGNGAETVFPAVGYADPKHPIVDTVTFDRSISPRGIFTQVFYQTKTGAPFQLKFCKNPFVANPDPCISTLIVLFNPFNPVVNGDVQVRILLTSGSDPSRRTARQTADRPVVITEGLPAWSRSAAAVQRHLEHAHHAQPREQRVGLLAGGHVNDAGLSHGQAHDRVQGKRHLEDRVQLAGAGQAPSNASPRGPASPSWSSANPRIRWSIGTS